MSEVVEVDTVEGDCRVLMAALARGQPGAWWTAREVSGRLGRWQHVSVRHVLRELADAGAIETKLTGSEYRPLREYRGKRDGNSGL